MIYADYYTDLENFENEEWPSQLVAVPRVGEYVQSKTGMPLTVLSITYAMGVRGMVLTSECITQEASVPVVIIELGVLPDHEETS